MTQSEAIDIQKIVMNTLKVVPKAWDMHGQNFNCDCHLEVTDRTFQLVSKRFNTTIEDAIRMVDDYFNTISIETK
jgi:hypothetical protein